MEKRNFRFQLCGLVAFILIWSMICHGQDNKQSPEEISVFKDAYLGQKPPGLKPEIFAPDVISGKYSLHGFPTFSPDGKEIYWSVIPPEIMFIKFENGKWSEPATAPFSDGHNITSANFSPDGKKLYYQSVRPGGKGSVDIWYVRRTSRGWSRPMNLRGPVNSPKLEAQPTFTKDGTIYFTGELEGAMLKRGIYRSRYVNGRYQRPELLPPHINTKYLEIYPFIASDESYLLFCSTRPSMNETGRRIYISFRSDNDSWSEPVNLNEKINFDELSAFPYVSPDGKYLFFSSGGNIYWMDAAILAEVRKQVTGDQPKKNTTLSVSFRKSEQKFNATGTMSVALGDVDSDGDLDAVLANKIEGRIWFNDGAGTFTDSGQKLADWGHGVAVDDLDSDGDMDIFFVRNGAPSKVYLNNGKGAFRDNGQSLGDIGGKFINGLDVQLADVDGDNDTDALVGYNDSNDMFWLNDGNGMFSKSDIQFDVAHTLCDLDGDGDIDVFCKELGKGYKIMLNDGTGTFRDNWKTLNKNVTYGHIKLADFDKDGDPDAIVTNGDYSGSTPTEVWLNDGKGRFTNSGQDLGTTKFARVGLGDFNKDGHVDAFISNMKQPNQIWLNNGSGIFVDSGLRLSGNAPTAGCAVGDLDGDDDLDIVVGVPRGGKVEVWFNDLIH